MGRAMIVSAGANSNEYLSARLNELGYARPVIVPSGTEARRRMLEADFELIIVNAPLPDGYTMRMIYMFRRQPCTTIDVDFLRRNIRIQNKTDDILHRAFGTNEQPTWGDFECFLQERCFPKTRGRLKDELRALGLDSYDPLQIVEKTNGRTAEDDLWLKIQYSQT